MNYLLKKKKRKKRKVIHEQVTSKVNGKKQKCMWQALWFRYSIMIGT